MDYLSVFGDIASELFIILFESISTMTLDTMIELFASVSLYAYPVLILLNAKIKTRKLNISKIDSKRNDILRYMYVKKTLFWMLMCSLYALSMLMDKDDLLNNLSSPTMVVYFGLSWGLIGVEMKSIYSAYKETKNVIYVPTLKRPSFWILMTVSGFKLWRLVFENGFGAPEQILAILDFMSYIFMFLSIFIFIFFDKEKDVVDKALRKSRKIVISIKNNVVKDERQRRKRNNDIKKILKLLKIYVNQVSDEHKKRDVSSEIEELEVLLMISSD